MRRAHGTVVESPVTLIPTCPKKGLLGRQTVSTGFSSSARRAPSEVDPVSWTPARLRSRSPRWPRRDYPTRPRSAARWWNWCTPAERRRSLRRSLNRRRSRSGTGLRSLHGTYGAPRVHAELAAKGTYIARKRVARLMMQAGLAGVSRRRFVTTTVKDGGRQAPDLVERNFAAEAPDLLWVADITYIPTWAGFLYLAVVLDAYSRRIVGWSMATTLATQLVLDALNMALLTRRPTGVIHHSDQGSQAALK